MIDTRVGSVLTGLLVAPTPKVDGGGAEHPYMPQLKAVLAAESKISLVRAKKLFSPAKTSKTLLSEVSDAEFVMVDVSSHVPGSYFYMGFAKALGKPIIALRRHGSPQVRWVERTADFIIDFEATPTGLEEVGRRLRDVFDALLHAQALDHQVLLGNYQEGVALDDEEGGEEEVGEALDWTALSPTEHENLCLELLLRHGLSEVRWLDETNEIDLLALRPLESQVHDLYLVSIGSGLEDDLTMQLWIADFQKVFPRIVEISTGRQLRRVESRFVLNLVFIWASQNQAFTVTKDELQKLQQRISAAGKDQFTVRSTVWDRASLEKLVHQSPMLVRKYFTQEWRESVESRKSAEELYRDAADFVQRAIDAARDLQKKYGEDPGKKWQHLAYTATHSIGNAIFPVEIYVDQLGEIVEEAGDREGVLAVKRAQENIEKAKVHIKKFKSIASSRENWTLSEIDVVPHIARSLDTARSQGVQIDAYYPDDAPLVHADADRIDEIFDEFVANSFNWLEPVEAPRITVTVKAAQDADLPPSLERDWSYLWVRYADNGPGVEHELKEKIFELFYSQSLQGMGFGLSIARKYMRGFGGDVIETGTPGVGAQFDFFFRIAPVD